MHHVLQLCFAPELGNCSLEKLRNEECDEGCYTQYCFRRDIGSTFSEPQFGVDMMECPWPRNSSNSLVGGICTMSDSIYLDPNIKSDSFASYGYESYGECCSEWIGDGTYPRYLSSTVF